MTTMIFIDKENGEAGATKSQLRFPSGSSKVFSERIQVNTPHPKKITSASPAPSFSVRKALGNVNRTEGVKVKLEKTEKNPPCTKTTGRTAELDTCDEEWPEKENMFPSDPRDFDSFELPEEDKINNIDLHGVPLMVFERTYDKFVSMVPSPVKKQEDISWGTDLLQSTNDFLATLDEIIDMPPLHYDF
ncbi:PTTG1 protein, partial [Turnix velox]|nr:PTTG1 protein [Turnix velox]